MEVDCTDIFKSGQRGVAMSRVTSANGLGIVNFHKQYVSNLLYFNYELNNLQHHLLMKCAEYRQTYFNHLIKKCNLLYKISMYELNSNDS